MTYATAGAGLAEGRVARGAPYLSTPWIYRIGVIAYVEGPLCFYHMALLGLALGFDGPGRTDGRCWSLLGLLAGGAMGCNTPPSSRR